MTQAKDKHLFALTGSIGSGKSQAAIFFQEAGFHVFDADVISHAISTREDVLQAVSDYFGPEYLTPQGDAFEREKIAARVFSDAQAKSFLEGLLHPLIRQEFLSELSLFRKLHPLTPALHIVPLFFEARLAREAYQAVLVVAADDDIRMKRICARDACSLEQAQQRDAAQMPQAQKIDLADYVIWNNEGLEELREAVQGCVKQLDSDKQG